VNTTPDGPSLQEFARDGGERGITSVRRRTGAERTPGSVLITVAA